MSLQLILHRRWPLDPKLIAAWTDLFRSCPTATPFQSPAWQTAWWEQLAGRRQPLTVLGYEGDDLIGVLPLSMTPGPWRAVRAAGSGVSDYLGSLVLPQFEDAFAEELAAVLPKILGIDLIDLHQLREGHPLLNAFGGGRKYEQAKCCVLSLPDSYEEYLGSLSKSLRYDARSVDRGEYKTGEAKIELTQGAEDIQKGLDTFFELHHRRWKKRGLPGAFAMRRTRDFHRRFAQLAENESMIRLSLLKLHNKPVGAIYALRAGQSYYFYQSGFLPEFKSLCPGTVLVAHTIRLAIDEGASTFDFLRGDEPYKHRWKPQRVLTNYRLLIPSRGARGSFGRAWNDMAHKVELGIRKRLEGRGLVKG